MTSNHSSHESIKPVIIVHGGAWSIPDSLKLRHLNGVTKAVKAGYQILVEHGSALDAVERAVVCMEEDPIFDAGVGSFLNEEGYVELDALIMDGNTLNAGAIGAVSNCRNPIILARMLLEEDNSPIMLVGQGADKFAEKMKINTDPKDLIIPREQKRWEKGNKGEDIFSPNTSGTVGAVALDEKGHLASATSTGGSPYKMVGRLGDSPIIGSGGYASEVAAVSSTGHGESFMKLNAAKLATDLIEQGYPPQDAAKAVIEKISDINGYGGIITVDRLGRIGYFFSTTRMAYAYISKEGKLVSGIDM
ncbi:MAG: isoaspartyl peptidase/L-asparaginase [Candidatus Heimdallarchaeota archaeon]|nr:MAG: isoaspartyl peptidase/L-asparaginase [Candidatus Heimdallarchaeota archaeon]